jgi:hypothetical protein
VVRWFPEQGVTLAVCQSECGATYTRSAFKITRSAGDTVVQPAEGSPNGTGQFRTSMRLGQGSRAHNGRPYGHPARSEVRL